MSNHLDGSFPDGTSDTRLLRDDEDGIRLAADLLRSGKLVVFPTETVYGLGADATNERACSDIFSAKGRPADNPLIVHFSEAESLLERIVGTSAFTRRVVTLLEAFSPGPLTLVVPRFAGLTGAVSAGLSTVAVRIPAHPVARRLISAAGVPIAAPSANRSGRPSPTDFPSAVLEMRGRVAAVMDSGECAVGLESTVLDITSEIPVVLRPGVISAGQIAEALGQPIGSATQKISTKEAVRSPGTRYRHYRPDVPIIGVPVRDGEIDDSRWMRRLTVSTVTSKEQIRVVATERAVARITAEISGTVGAIEESAIERRIVSDHGRLAAILYREFFLAERDGVGFLVVECPVDNAALRDRLSRASE